METSEHSESNTYKPDKTPQNDSMHEVGEILLQHYTGIILIINQPEQKIRFVNKVFSEILGYDESDLQLSDYQLLPCVFQEDLKLMEIELAKLEADTGCTTNFICRLNVKNGNYRYFKITGNTIVNYNNSGSNVILFLGEDISETMAIKKELADTRNLIMETENFLNFGVYNWDYNTNTTKWSKGMYRIFNIQHNDDTSDVSLEGFMDFVDEEDKPVLQQAIDDSIQFNKHYEVEYTIHPKNAPPRIVVSRGKVINNLEGNLKILGITCDITDLKLLDRERERMIHDLYRSNLELEEFAYVASHDLHEPLRKISTFSERLQSRFKGELPAEAEIYLKRIVASTGNMRMLIDNLLEFSRVSRYQPERKEINLSQIITDVKAELELVIEESGAIITCGELPTIQGGYSHIRRLFSNLIANAIKFSREDVTPEIEITASKLNKAGLEKHSLPGDRIFYNIQVKDNGIGFDEEYSQRIFQIFQRLHGKSEYPGSGIGLAICKKIVENHGGMMYAKGITSQGSTFFINLPEKQ